MSKVGLRNLSVFVFYTIFGILLTSINITISIIVLAILAVITIAYGIAMNSSVLGSEHFSSKKSYFIGVIRSVGGYMIGCLVVLLDNYT